MADIIVRIAEDEKNSNLLPVGKALMALSKNQTTITDAGGAATNTSDIPSNWSGWPDSMKAHAEDIYANIALSIYEDAGDPEIIEAGNPDAVKAVMALKFVFEAEGEMVVPIPYQGALEQGAKRPPLGTRKEYHLYLRKAVFEGAKADFLTALAVSSLTDTQKAEVTGIYDAVADDGLAPGDDTAHDMQTFHTQLGEYSIRQCQ